MNDTLYIDDLWMMGIEMYIVLCCISIVLVIVSVILLIIGFKKEDKYQSIAGIIIAIISLCVVLNIDVPTPIIFPLNNDL